MAAIAPIAAHTGKSTAPTTPKARGTSIKVFPCSFLIIILLMFPALISSFTFLTSSSQETLNSSFLIFSFSIKFLPHTPRLAGFRG